MTSLESELRDVHLSNGHKQSGRDTVLLEFKKKLGDTLVPTHDDYYLAKWLKARNYDVGKAAEMYTQSMAYRQKMNVDTILTDYVQPEVLQKYMPGGFAGYDKEGSPIRVELFGYLDFKGILHSARKVDIEKCKLQQSERVMSMLDEQSKKLGVRVEGMTVIIDLDQVGPSMLWGPGMQMLAHMGKVIQDNYPESVKRSIIVNAPRIFPLLWRMIRPLITEEMKRKVCILGAGYKKELLELIDADQLPTFLGGTLTDADGDPRCPSRICQGGKVPESYFLKELTSLDHMTTISVLQKDKYRLKFRVDQVGSILRWEFRTNDYDIAFGVNFDSVSTGKIALVKLERINSHMLSEDGSLVCDRIGTYYVVFDNSYSFLRAKKVHYNIDILPPEDSGVVRDIDTVTAGGSWQEVAAEETEMTKL